MLVPASCCPSSEVTAASVARLRMSQTVPCPSDIPYATRPPSCAAAAGWVVRATTRPRKAVGSSTMALGRRRRREWDEAADAAGYEEFDPLNRVNLGRSVEMALLSRPLTRLNAVPPFWGTGIYAIYFRGSVHHRIYGRLAESASPIYVGRAVPRGSRKGLVEPEEGRRSRALWSRLDHHRASIEQIESLNIDDFACRWLVADMLFVPMAERPMPFN